MATKNITVFLTNEGSPATGLSPTVRIRKVSDGTLVVTDGAMTELGDGFYKYAFTSYDAGTDYVIRIDGTATLSAGDRYHAATNLLNNVEQAIKIWTNKLQITGNQQVVYDDDGSTALYTWDLKDASGNPTQTNVLERDPA